MSPRGGVELVIVVNNAGAAKEKAVMISPPCKGNQPIWKRSERFFLPAFVAQPHHAADLAGRGHHLRRLHGFSAALGDVQVDYRFFGGCFRSFAHFRHLASPPGS